MKALFNDFLRIWVKWGLSIYFSRIEVSGTNRIPRNTPIIIIANHQNALLDPLLIATVTGMKPYFLARADLFKKPLFAKLLSIIQLIPVFRIRDGLSSISGNQESFSRCEDLLAKNQSILIFPEGNHSLRRNARPLSKGFTRIAFGAMGKHTSLPLSILPFGISYEAHQKVGAAVRVEVGKPILVSSYLNDSRGLTKTAYKALKELTVHIPDEGYEESLISLKENHIPLTSPEKVRDFLSGQQPIHSPNQEFSSVKKIRWLTLLLHWPLWLVWKRARKKIKDPVFYGTFKFVIGLVGCPLYYIFIILLSWLLGYGIVGFLFALAAFFSLIMYTKI
ncbi:lysophospholipid acyltransferase family protein [Lunatibacter salilacus]|uniref:lysophospholipid acyltransferase family protein n=1 Tax=Lunatibacter salilacus TaxID=2483804 RepID=UPI00131C794C|nr:lysophospholipid acyltransferase family protein [Lunatibacter salilacus]